MMYICTSLYCTSALVDCVMLLHVGFVQSRVTGVHLEKLSGGGGGGKSGMLLTLGGGGGGDEQRGVLCTPHAWACSPWKIRPSEIISGAFSSKFTLPMICIYYTLLTTQPCIEKQWQPSFKGGCGVRFW